MPLQHVAHGIYCLIYSRARVLFAPFRGITPHVVNHHVRSPVIGAFLFFVGCLFRFQKYEQGMDLEGKEEGSDEAMRNAARGMCDNYKKLVSLQKWHKQTEGDTMHTCAR